MTTELGTELGTTLGTILASMEVEGLPTFDTSKVYALSGFSAANYFATQAGGGEAGATGGFGIFATFIPQSIAPPNVQMLTARYATNNGYQLYLTTAGVVTASASAGSGTYVNSPTRSLAASDVGKAQVALLYHDGAKLRLWLSRQQVLDGTAAASYTAASGVAQSLGTQGGTLAAGSCLILNEGSFRGTLTDTQILALFDAIRATGDIPASFPGASHRHSLRDTLLAPNVPVSDNAAAPASIPDSVTGASADAMARVGTPVVRVIDPASYPRTMHGVMGFSATSRLQSPAGLLNTATISVEAVVTFTSSLGSSKHILSNATGSSGVGGFSLYQSASTLNLYSYGAGALVASASIPSAGTGYPRTIKVEYTGSVWRLHLDGLQQGADNAAGHTPSTLPLCIGTFGDGTNPSDNVTWHSLRTGTIANPSQHFYDFTQDVIANGGPQNGVPALVLDRVGTDHLTPFGVSVRANGISTSAGEGDYLVSALGGGMRGDPAGFYAYWMGRVSTLTMSGAAVFVETVSGNSAGWSLQAGSSDFTQLRFAMFDGSGAFKVSASVNAAGLIAADQDFIIHGVWTGSALRFYINGTQVGADVSLVGYTPPAATAAMFVGSRGGTLAPKNTTHLGVGGGSGVPTGSQISAHASSCLAAVRAVAISGFTGKRWDFRQDIADAGGALPGVSAERTASASTDTLVRIGSPLQVSARTERLWSYETSPILYGGRAFTSTSYLRTASSQGLGGDATGFWMLMVYRPDTSNIATSRHIMSCTVTGSGWVHYASANNSVMQTLFADGGGTYRSGPTYTVAASEIGKLQIAVIGWDAVSGRIRVMAKRGELGAPGTAITGFTPSTAYLDVGNGTGAGAPLDGITWVGAAYGTGGFPTLAQYQATYDLIMATEDVQPMLGMTTRNLWSVKRSLSGGTWGATVEDQNGTAPLTVNGTPTLEPIYARAWAT